MIEMRLTGLDEAKKALRLMGQRLEGDVTDAATRAAATAVARQVRQYAPVGSGPLKEGRTRRLRRLIRTRRVTRGLTAPQRRLGIIVRSGGTAYVVYPDGPGFYALFLEFGTSKRAPRPFMRPAFRAAKDRAVAVFLARVKREVSQLLAGQVRRRR